MCGIAGFYGPPDADLLSRMCSSLYHRGPDDEGSYENEMASLSMRRLSIIDLATGHQPICNETGDIWVVFNGEIYNYEHLRDSLARAGHTFRTASDTETIVHAYEEYGLDFPNHLRGMFGIAIWDEKRRRLILARDRIGEKPLFFKSDGDRVLFGSELKAVLQGVTDRAVDAQSVCDFLSCGYVAESRTFFQGISKLRPGELAVVDEGGIKISRYWEFRPSEKRQIGFADACQELEERLLETMRLCLKSDVEVAAFLSGGLDSSIITAMMKKHEAQIQTFSVGYRGSAEGYNELGFAQQVSKHVGTVHHELILDAKSNIQLLPKVIAHFDEPHGEPTSILVYLLCEFVSKRVKVALGGTGGDEIFFGYPRHAGLRYLKYYAALPRWMRESAIPGIASLLRESTSGGNVAKRVKRFVDGAGQSPAMAYLSWVRLLNESMVTQLLERGITANIDNPSGDDFQRDILAADGEKGTLEDRIVGLDVRGYLPEYQLTYMDRMSMAASLEVRSPLSDYSLLEFVTSLPNNYRLKGTRSKHILKEISKKYLPQSIVDRKKVGFDSPIGQWFKDDLRGFLEEFLSAQNVAKTGILDPDAVQTMLADHWRGRKNYALHLWSVVALEAWARMYIEDGFDGTSDYRLIDMRGGEAAA